MKDVAVIQLYKSLAFHDLFAFSILPKDRLPSFLGPWEVNCRSAIPLHSISEEIEGAVNEGGYYLFRGLAV